MLPIRSLLRTKTSIFAILALLLLTTFGVLLAQPVSVQTGDTVMITVHPGMSAAEIGELLFQKDLIKSVFLFRLTARMEGVENGMQAGEYALTSGMSIREICRKLAAGETYYREFTIPEGFTVDQVAALLETKKLGSAARFKELAQNYAPYEYMTPSASVKYAVEGFLFPDTYRVNNGATEEDILKMMVDHFNERFTPELRQQIEAAGLSPRDAVTMASLVEKEAKLPADAPVISGVFINRLKLDMPLQSCATIQYILGYPKPELSVQDTELPSPYNTYQNKGLPPGPIANPGIAALEAAIHPAATDYLYFVADDNGAHHFSRTYEEHLAAIAEVRH